jgi:hypothetical protein
MGKPTAQKSAAAVESTTDNVVPLQAVATEGASTAVAIFKPKLVRIITKPLFKWVNNVARFYKVDGPMFIGKTINEGAGKPKKDPATLMFVTDLETGEQGQCICATVLRSVLNEEYPGDAYVGKSFAIKQNKIVGKDYNGFDVAEIEG